VPTETTTDVSPTRYFWLQLGALAAGLGLLVLAHHVTRWRDVTVVVVAMALTSLAVVARTVQLMVAAAFSDAHRIFRTRHLLACATLLFVVAAGTAGVVLVRGPFGKLFAHGRIGGEDVVDVAGFGAAVVCMVGAGVALSGAWERMHVERDWMRTLHRPVRPDA
jgi:hypothetical protein